MEGLVLIGSILSLLGLLLACVQALTVKAPGNALAQRFRDAGTLSGRTKDEIVAFVGPPSSMSGLPNGKTLLQWMATGYHIALRFDGDICDGVTHEVKV